MDMQKMTLSIPQNVFVFPPGYKFRDMDFVVDHVDFSVSEFYETFGHNLPKVVIVTQGFFGEIVDDTFDKDQVYRIHTTSRQKRIIAKSTDRHYSIPLNYPLKVSVVKKHGKLGKEQTVKDVITEHAFPVDIRFAGNQEFAVGGSTTCANRFPQLKLIDVFDEVYFLANTIIDGVIDLKVVPIPLYLSLLRLAEITGIKDQSAEKWKRYTTELNELVTNSVEFDTSFGNKDIAEYHQDSFKADTVYTYIEPRTYGNIFSVNQFQPTRGPSRKLVIPDGSANVYEEIQKTNRRSDVLMPLTEVGVELKSFFQERELASVVGRPVPNVPVDDYSNATHVSDDSKKKSKPSTPKLPARSPGTNVSLTTSNSNSKAAGDGGNFDIGGDTKTEKKNNSPTPKLPKRDPSTKVSSAPAIPPKPNPYVNEIPRGTITPTTQPDHLPLRKPPEHVVTKPQPSAKPTRTGSDDSMSSKQNDDSGSKTFDVAKLSIKELADCMTTLKLSKYIDLFKEHMIDGEILKEVDTELLKSDFGFNTIEAIRLMKFAKDGHIPK